MLYDKYPFELPPLPYPYEALEPYIDRETMHLHHDKHFKAYIDNLNKALKPYPQLQSLPLIKLLSMPWNLPDEVEIDIMRSAGGTYNHSVYFEKIAPPGEKNIPSGKLLKDINNTFGSFEKFKDIFSQNARSVFGSGYTFLVRTKRGTLKIVNTANQNTPIAIGQPVLAFDVWEHAYYLKYKNVRADYISNLWNIAVFEE